MRVPVQRYTGIVYRAHHPMWSFAPLSGEGAKKHGGQFNRPGNKALYTSLDPTTAWMEAQQGFPFKPQPMTLVAYQVDSEDIADLNNSKAQLTLGCSPEDLACSWEDLVSQKHQPPTWLLVDKLQTLGIAGILIRCFAVSCTEQNQNLVLWDWSNVLPHSIQVIDSLGHLPKSRESWPDKTND